MLKLSLSEPQPLETLAARFALEQYLKILPKDASALSVLADLLASDYLNRWNAAENDPAAARFLIDEAEQRVQQALAIDQTLALAHYAKGLVLRARGNFGDAKKEFAALAADYPAWAAAIAHEGNEWINLGDPAKGLPLAQKAIALQEKNGIFYWIEGRAYFFLREYEKAIQSLRQSVDLRDNIWYNRLYLISAYTKRTPQDRATRLEINTELANFRKAFRLFDRNTLKRYESDIANPSLNRDEFYKGLDDAGF